MVSTGSARLRVAATLFLLIAAALPAYPARRRAVAPPGKFLAPISHVMIVVLENTDDSEAVRQPFLAKLISEGALLRNYQGVAHPSQPNYIALTAGSTRGVTDDKPVTLNVPHIGDLLEAKGLTWKTYAQSYPGGCALQDAGLYARRHVPFLNYANIQQNAQRCTDHIVDASELWADVAAGTLPNYSFYVPNDANNGHDTSPAFADRWLENEFGGLLHDPRFTTGLLFIVTYDENESWNGNRVATVLWGERVRGGSVSNVPYNHYSLLRTVEDILGTGTLGLQDQAAHPIDDVIVR
jgi:hypothetical protein